jgi:hypothetical protein
LCENTSPEIEPFGQTSFVEMGSRSGSLILNEEGAFGLNSFDKFFSHGNGGVHSWANIRILGSIQKTTKQEFLKI